MNFDMSDSLVVEGASTPTYVAILDENGEMVSAIVDINIDHHMDAAFIDSKASVIEGAEYMFLEQIILNVLSILLKNMLEKQSSF